MQEKQSYWFNPKTREVEVGPKSLAVDRLGPFATAEEAARAEQIISERARRIREDDEQDD